MELQSRRCSRLVPAAGPNIEIYVRSENVIILVSSSRNSHTGLIISLVTGHSVSGNIFALLITILDKLCSFKHLLRVKKLSESESPLIRDDSKIT